ncbi:GNAT family N-acetyltransferase [Micromonospora lupini]|uniref:GNAT family N-acetyltransferase n=1 Tax=Micromonospora lupini TaxID=285679 RepID=UPI0022510FC7|nr:GNAT family N-acetyltransferase [Micromonospora lupini]MCX5069450.1 GNAT family N-acetyltransferase [Micromonospora lupini]
MTDGLILRRYSADEAKGLLDQLVDLYLEVYVGSGEFYSEDRYRRQLDLHMQRSGWELVTATIGGAIVGYIYGFPLPPETQWWEGIHEPVPPGFTEEDGTRTFALSELLVHRAWRRQGIAAALHNVLVTSRTEARTTLLVHPDNATAQTAYRSWGWRKVTELQPQWKGAPTFAVLVHISGGDPPGPPG